MSKPDWNDAPEWAEYLAMDASGKWYFYPGDTNVRIHDNDYMWCHNAKTHTASFAGVGDGIDWRLSLEKKPGAWPTDDRIDAIGQNGNTGEHYEHDEVNNPKHYDLFPGGQSIDIIRAALTEEEWRGFLKGNVLKYRLRAGEKGPADKCLAKANWYREKLWEQSK